MKGFMGHARGFLVLAAFLSTTRAADAQPATKTPQPEPPRFEAGVVVTPERGEAPRALVPASTEVLEGTAVPELPATHASEVISLLPGFTVARPEYHAGKPVVSARGFFGGGEADYILMLVDGVPVADVESGLVDWSLVPLSSIRRVEAFRGPGASMYGDSAVGGVIQILTDKSSSARATATGGSFATFTADGTYGRRATNTGFFVSGITRRTDGGFEHSGGHQLLGAGGVDGRAGGFAWAVTANGDTRQRDDPGSLSRAQFLDDPYGSDPLYRFDGVDRSGFSSSFVLRHDTNSWRPQARIYTTHRDEDLIRTILLAPSFGDRRARALTSTAVGGSAEGERGVSNAQLLFRFGVDLAREQLDTSYSSVSPTGVIGALNSEASGRRLRTGAFVSSSWDAHSRVRIYGALRWDDVDDDGFTTEGSNPAQRAWSPRAGVAARVSDRGAVTAYVQASRAFKAPTLDQRFDPRPYPDFQGGTFSISNPNLVPQRATNVEAGVSGGGRVRWSALAYRMGVEDEIDFDARTFSYANIGRSTHTGLELEVDGRWWQRLQPSISYALSRVEEVDGNTQLKNVPRHALSLAAHASLPWNIGAFARFRHTWGAFLDDENALAIDGPSVLDFRVRRSIGRHALFVDAMNVTGDKYEEFGFTLSDIEGNSYPYVYPGAPRAFRAGMTLAF
jgi:outer membrane cobalamin receptor